MCLNPVTFKNRSKYIDYKHGSYMYYSAPCGYCVECEQDKINSYLARAAAEHAHTERVGGLCYVDCLTYNDIFLPMWKDDKIYRNNGKKFDTNHCYDGIPVFSSKDIRRFFMRLNTNMRRAGYYIPVQCERVRNGNIEHYIKKIVPIKRFMSMEYGGQWHRPHMHVIFDIGLKIDPKVFDDILRKSWSPYGITDSFNKDGSEKKPYQKVVRGNGAISYVSKYCVKDDDYFIFLAKSLCAYQMVKDGKINDIREVKSINDVVLPHFENPRELRNFVRETLGNEVFNAITPRMLLSNGFGSCLAEKTEINECGELQLTEDYQFMYDTGLMHVYTEKDGKRVITNTIKIPKYIERKLWQKDVVDFDGTHHWELNEDGLQRKLDRVNMTIDLLANRFRKITDNLSNYIEHTDYEQVEKVRNQIYCFLNGRSFEEFAVYLSCYKGRLYEHFNLDDIYLLAIKDKNLYSQNLIYQKDRISLDYEDFDLQTLKKLKLHVKMRYSSKREQYAYMLEFFERHYLVSENSHIYFYDFDKLYNLFAKLEKKRNDFKRVELLKKKELKNKDKMLSLQYRQHELLNQVKKQRNNLLHRAALTNLLNVKLLDVI